MNRTPVHSSICLALAMALAPIVAIADDAAPSAPAPAQRAAAQDADLAQAREELREARAQLREVTRRIGELSSRLGSNEAPRAYAFQYLSDPDHAMIGVVLAPAREGAPGVALAAVTPGGPADKAGLRGGDRIVAINGKPVPKGAGALDSARSLIGKLKAGDKVTLSVDRGNGERQDLVASAERRESWDWPALAAGMAPLPPGFDRDMQIIIEKRIEGDGELDARTAEAMARRDAIHAQGTHELGRTHADGARLKAFSDLRRIVVSAGGGFFNLRLADLNPGLGKYFGSDSGVLVLDLDGESLAGIQPGDVLLSIGGERTESSGAVMRALRTRADNDAVNVELMRERKRQVVVVDIPASSEFDVMFAPPPPPPAPPKPPAPAPRAAPPAPPAPPAPAHGVAL